MPRVEFSAKTKDIVARRAGYKCSLPQCGRTTLSAGASSGVAAHIFAASEQGPRGQGSRTSEELRAPSNAIWLCSEHARLVDASRGERYSPETLLSLKSLHEARNELEHQGLYRPISWLWRIAIQDSPIFASGQHLELAKLNLVIGDNGSGKTALVDWIDGAFGAKAFDRWCQFSSQGCAIDYSMSLLSPLERTVRVQLGRCGPPKFWLDGTQAAFNPLLVRVFRVGEHWLRPSGGDDLRFISRATNLSEDVILGLADSIAAFPEARIRRVGFKREGGGRRLYFSSDERHVPSPLQAHSGRAIEQAVIEFVSAAARESGRAAPTVLLLDSPYAMFNEWPDWYEAQLLHERNRFQTIVCVSHRPGLSASSRWAGWRLIQLRGHPPHVLIDADARGSLSGAH